MIDRGVYKALCTRTKNMSSDSRTSMDALLLQLSKPSVLENYDNILSPAPSNHLTVQLPWAKHKMSQQPQFLCKTFLQEIPRFVNPIHITSHLNRS